MKCIKVEISTKHVDFYPMRPIATIWAGFVGRKNQWGYFVRHRTRSNGFIVEFYVKGAVYEYRTSATN